MPKSTKSIEPTESSEIRALDWRQRCAASLLAAFLKLWHFTLRWRFEDHCGFTQQSALEVPLIWCFWHNRILVMPGAYRRAAAWRSGSVMTSASHDGAFLAAVMARFGVGAVRGSSSRRGRAALREMVRVLDSGGDAVITPDGPRGPRYRLAPGIIRLAQQSGAQILPIQVKYQRAKMLKTWDALRLPLPFSQVTVSFGELFEVPAELDEASFESTRAQLESLLLPPAKERALEPQKDRK